MSIPHDYYIKFIENSVFEDTLLFHNKGNFTIHSATQHMSTLHRIPEGQLKTLTGNELQLNTIKAGDKSHCFQLPGLHDHHPLNRNDSCDHFERRELDFQDIRLALSPLLRKSRSASKRGYPSGGALYPVEVFCFNINNQIKAWPSESCVLHLLPSSKQFEIHSPNINQGNLRRAIAPDVFNIGSPACALIYFIYLPKTLFKYRYRGYRLAHMEAGSMYMLVDLSCAELSLKTRLWSGFTDHQVTQTLNLNPTLFLPACVQLIG